FKGRGAKPWRSTRTGVPARRPVTNSNHLGVSQFMSKTRKQLERMFLFVLFFAAPALAQFEIAPDHFPSADELAVQPASTHAAQREQRVAEQQAILAEYRAQIKGKSESVEVARQEAISAGIQGDGAGSYIEAYDQQRKELELL